MRQTFLIQTVVRKTKEIARQLMYSSTKHNVKQARIEKKKCYPLTSIYAAMAALLDPEGSLSFFIASNMRSSSLITYIKKSH